MLNEINDVTQYETGKHRRWFHDDYFDLYTWETPEGALQENAALEMPENCRAFVLDRILAYGKL